MKWKHPHQFTKNTPRVLQKVRNRLKPLKNEQNTRFKPLKNTKNHHKTWGLDPATFQKQTQAVALSFQAKALRAIETLQVVTLLRLKWGFRVVKMDQIEPVLFVF